MRLTDEQIAALRDGTEGVTPGPWASSDWSEDDGPNAFTIGAASNQYRVAETHEGDNPLKDAAHIARCDPDTIRGLATEVLESRAKIAAKDARISDLVLMLDRQFGTPCEQIRHRQEIEKLLDVDRLEEIITDSIDLDWTPRDAAKAIVRAMGGDGT